MVVDSSSASTWALFKEQVDDTLYKALEPKIVYPIVTEMVKANGPVMEYNTTDSYLTPEQIGDIAEYPSQTMEFTRNTASIKDIGLSPRLPLNWIKDARWDLVNDHVDAMAKGIARSMNSDFLTATNTFVAGGDYNGVTYSAVTNHTVTAAATWASASADPIADINDTLAALGADDAATGEKFLFVHPTPMRKLMMEPTLLKAVNYGNPDLIQKGIYPTPFGVSLVETSQAATTYALMINKDAARFKYYEREPLTTEMEKAPRAKALDLTAYIRYAFACPRPLGIAKINTIA